MYAIYQGALVSNCQVLLSHRGVNKCGFLHLWFQATLIHNKLLDIHICVQNKPPVMTIVFHLPSAETVLALTKVLKYRHAKMEYASLCTLVRH